MSIKNIEENKVTKLNIFIIFDYIIWMQVLITEFLYYKGSYEKRGVGLVERLEVVFFVCLLVSLR